MSIVTRVGDGGKTLLPGGVRVRKDDPRIEAIGSLDELSTALGFARSFLRGRPGAHAVHRIQQDMVRAAAVVAGVQHARFGQASTVRVEHEICALERVRAPQNSFHCSGGSSPGAAALDVARAVARRAERRVVSLDPPVHSSLHRVQIYLNRVSDLLFLLCLAAGDMSDAG